MEFPSLGKPCQYGNCNQNDFLPLQCKCCKIFCRFHFNDHCVSKECELCPKPGEINLNKNDQIFRCSEKGCNHGSLLEMLCLKCDKHYCIDHRFHLTCPEIDEETIAAKLKQLAAPRRQFQEANKHLQDQITENIRKALQSSTKVKTASKIHLMRIKQKAIGMKTIPATDRLYFAIGKPANMEPKPVTIVENVANLKKFEFLSLDPDLKGSVPVFISSKWSLGRALDSICDVCNIPNDNNKPSNKKLRIFRQLDRYCISPLKMDVEVCDLIKNETLLEGDKLLVEYVDNEILCKLNECDEIFLC